jgi:hypothetical protein
MNSNSNQFGPSLTFIYFMIGFVIGFILSIIILTLLRPYLPVEAVWVQSLVFAPLIIGLLIGSRVTKCGKREQLTLGRAILTAFGLRKAH